LSPAGAYDDGYGIFDVNRNEVYIFTDVGTGVYQGRVVIFGASAAIEFIVCEEELYVP